MYEQVYQGPEGAHPAIDPTVPFTAPLCCRCPSRCYRTLRIIPPSDVCLSGVPT